MPSPPDDLRPPADAVVAEVRTRFVADFPVRCDTTAALIDATGDPAARPQTAVALRTAAHNLAGLSGIIGFRRVSALAYELESLTDALASGAAEPGAAHTILQSIRAAFAAEVVDSSTRDRSAAHRTHRGDVLVAEDDEDQRAILMSHLEAAGYRPHGVSSGTAVRRVARALTPSAILLDIELPGSDGYAVCRELKADAELAAVPIVFVTGRARLDDRLAGLSLGADDYLVKPVDPGELVIRLERLTARVGARAEAAGASGVLAYSEFLHAARMRLAHGAAALVLMRVPALHVNDAVEMLRQEIRRADIVAAYDRTHLVILLPELAGEAACARMNGLISRLIERGIPNASAGVACAVSAGASTVDALLAGADDALVQARSCGRAVALHGSTITPARQAGGASVLAADDDPDVIRIVDSAFRGAGYQTRVAFDGLEALACIERERPDVFVLDLMMPKLGGFDVLNRLQQFEQRRPKTIVLSARGREEDVVRAFDLGADDYLVKPFNPRELLARVARLLR